MDEEIPQQFSNKGDNRVIDRMQLVLLFMGSLQEPIILERVCLAIKVKIAERASQSYIAYRP